MKFYLAAFLISFFSCCILLILLKRFSCRQSIFRNNDEASFIGGTGLLLSFALGSATLFFYKNVYVSRELTHILLFAFFIFTTCLFDDFKEFSLFKKVLIQVIVVGLFLIKGKPIQIYCIPLWTNYIISFLWIVGITNIFNLLDIGDGFCAGVSLIACVAFFAVLFIGGNIITAGLFAALCGSLSAFLIFNFPPAKIMLGNSGSHFLGFLFATLSMHGDYATLDNPLSVLIPLVILAFPMMDTLYLIVVRLKKGIFPFRKSEDHIFLNLLSSGKGMKPALFEIYLVTLLWGISGVLLIFGLNPLFLIVTMLAALSSVRLILIVQHTPSH
ncbi:MAG: MraY family glycosyltransferase [Candidatus Orphnella occulta]|nr:MraY family glycosyltransferase [Candidatus Orphnella occulta]